VYSSEVFDISVLGAGSHLWLSVQSTQGSVFGVSRHWPEWPAAVSQSPIRWMSMAVGEARPDADQHARQIGEVLRELVFGVPDVAVLLQQARAIAAAQGGRLLVRLLLAPESVSGWPWELMTDPRQPDRFLALARDVHLVRSGRSRTYPVRMSTIPPPLNLLLVMSSPVQSGQPGDVETPFDLYEEKRSLLRELRPLIDRGLLTVEVEDRPTIDSLRRRIGAQKRGFHLFHYLGHAQPSGLRLEDRSGRGRLLLSQDVSMLLQQLPDLRLSVFAGCETARAPADGPELSELSGRMSTVDHCVRDACPMVIGMQAVLPFGTERLFTRFLYSAITAGQPVAEALRLARHAVAGDDFAGGTLVNWAVPCLFVGGALPGPLVDPQAKAVPPRRPRRVALRIGVRQEELRFISNLSSLRTSLDVLCGHIDARLLLVVGLPGTGKSKLLDRALEEVDNGYAQLVVNAGHLLGKEDPVLELCQLVATLIAENGGRTISQRGRSSARWWDRLLEEITQTPMVIVIDNGDDLRSDDPQAARLLEALSTLTKRRGQARLAVAATDELFALTSPLSRSEFKKIRLDPLAWSDVWQWIRRNLPILTRLGEAALAPYYHNLQHLEQWERLAERLAGRAAFTAADLPQLISQLDNTSVTAGTGPVATAGGPPLFGGSTPSTPAAGPSRSSLKVAIAGPFTSGREAEFARLVTMFAAEHGVAGRAAESGAGDNASLVAELLPLPSPFQGSDGTASMPEVVRWLGSARSADADIILLDLGGPDPLTPFEKLVTMLADEGRLVIAAGGVSGEPAYPAWWPKVLAVGALDATQTAPASYSPYFKRADKPDLYAPPTVAGTTMAQAVNDSTLKGPTSAALYVVAAAVAVWTTDRDLTATDVRTTLVNSGRPLAPPAQTPRSLDVTAALRLTRRQLLLDALERGPLALQDLLAGTGMRPEHAIPLLDDLVAEEVLRRTWIGQIETYENPNAIYAAFRLLRSGAAGPERTVQLERLVERARGLARRGRYRSDEVTAMWNSGEDGRRITALAVIQVRPDPPFVSIVLDAIGSSHTAFELYHALRAADCLVPQLDTDQLHQVGAAVEAVPAELRRPDSDRGRLVARVSAAITKRSHALAKRSGPGSP
jgi:hypothetical protein